MSSAEGRVVRIAAAQLGPIQRAHSRGEVVERMTKLMHAASEKRARLVVFPELALTTFFPRWYFEQQSDVTRGAALASSQGESPLSVAGPAPPQSHPHSPPIFHPLPDSR